MVQNCPILQTLHRGTGPNGSVCTTALSQKKIGMLYLALFLANTCLNATERCWVRLQLELVYSLALWLDPFVRPMMQMLYTSFHLQKHWDLFEHVTKATNIFFLNTLEA